MLAHQEFCCPKLAQKLCVGVCVGPAYLTPFCPAHSYISAQHHIIEFLYYYNFTFPTEIEQKSKRMKTQCYDVKHYYRNVYAKNDLGTSVGYRD